jgi:hypothetical protein
VIKVHANKAYYTLNGEIVMVIYVDPYSAWGIHGKIWSHNYNGSTIHAWSADSYPYILSHDPSQYDWSLTDNEVSPEDYPEVYI